jgi:hypothetical protein
MKKQSVKDLVFRVFGILADGGYAEDDMVDAQPSQDAVIIKTWFVKFRCMENSDFHRLMQGVYAQQQAGIQVSGSGLFRRSTSGETLQSSNVVIQRPPNMVAGKSPKLREWSFAFCDTLYTNVAPG